MSKRNGAVTGTGAPMKADENENVAAYRAKSGGLLLQVDTKTATLEMLKFSFCETLLLKQWCILYQI